MSILQKGQDSSCSKPRCIIYCRVSSLEQVANTSLEHQEKCCREYAFRNGWEVVEPLFIEKGESAKTADRTEFSKAINFASTQKNKIRYFVVYKTDRFARNAEDHFAVRGILRRSNVELRSATEQFDESPMGKAMEGVAAVFAELDNSNRSVRSKDGMVKRVREGIWVWLPPLGYKKVAHGKETNIVPDPERYYYIREIFELYAKGTYTYQGIAEHIGTRGLHTKANKHPSAQLIDKILRNSAYCGRIEAFGEVNRGSFEPIIAEALFEACKSVRDGEQLKPRSANNPIFPLRRQALCSECGAFLTGSRSKGKLGTRHAYYHHGTKKCPVSRSIPKAAFEQQFVELLDSIIPDEKYETLFKAIVLDVWKERYRKFDQLNGQVRQEISKLEQERQRVFELHRQGRYSDDEFIEQKNLVNARLAGKHTLIQDNRVREIDMEAALEYAFYFVRNASKVWLEAGYAQRVNLQKLIFAKPIPYDGQNFGTPDLSLVYQQKKTPLSESSPVVAPKKLITNFLRLKVDLLPAIKTCREDISTFLSKESTKPSLAVTY